MILLFSASAGGLGPLLPSPQATDTEQSPSQALHMPMDLDQPYGHQHDLMDSETMNKHAVDMQLAMQILQSVDLPPTCVNWDQGFGFLLHHFQPDSEVLLKRINTYSFIAGDACQLFRMANIAALTLLRELPIW